MALYNAPTKLLIDYDINSVGQLIKSYGYKKVLLVYGLGSIKKSGLYDNVINSLNANEVDYIELSGVEANPKVSLIREFSKRDEEFDFILAVGGGSVIDTAKNIAVSYESGLDPWVFNSHEVTPSKALPIGVILTISAAGSEMSSSCVITNMDINVKQGFNSELIRPVFAIMNAELTYSVSKYQTACGIVDIMMHTLERYISNERSMLADEFALGLLSTVVKNGFIAYNDPTNYQARKELMLASSFSHNGLTHIGRTYLLRAHLFEHIISGIYDEVAHGAGLAIVWPAYSKYVYKNPSLTPLFANLAYRVFDVDDSGDMIKDAYIGIVKMEEFFKSLNMPTSLNDLNIDESNLERFALRLTNDKQKVIKDVVDIDYDVAYEIFKLMYR